jgi:hypothetical protein
MESGNTVEQVTEQDIRRSMVNCSRGEAASLVLPKNMAVLDWEALDFLGWRDPKAPLRGYVVRWLDDRPVGIALRAAESRMSHRVAAMCLLCQSVHSGADVSLFTARRSGQAGRDGNTIGTYMCADLACCHHVRTGVRPTPDQPDPAAVVEDRRVALAARLDAFINEVLRP